MPTAIEFEKCRDIVMIGSPKEAGRSRVEYDDTFMMNVTWYEGRVTFEQRIKVKNTSIVRGEVVYSVCSREMCIPGSVPFEISVER
jgi:Disulphide bond corrector protein DsbC